MKKLTIICGVAVLLAGSVGCEKKDGIDDDLSFLNTATTTNTNKVFDISNDNSGNVKITPIGQGVSSSVISFGHGAGASASATVAPGNFATHAYPEGSYTVTIVSKAVNGTTTTATYPLVVTYRAPENIVANIGQTVRYMTIKPTALYAASYIVYFGDVAGETGTPVAAGVELNHTYPAAGVYNVKVVALSGGVAKTEKTFAVTVTDTFGLPITFEDPATTYQFGTFGDNQQFAKVANPNASGLNTSATVGKFTRGNQSWSGTYSQINAIDFAVGKKIRILAYNPDPALIGKKLNVELEAGSVPNGVGVVKTAFTTSGAWEELVFDFSGIAAIPATAKFSQLVLRFSDGVDGAGVGGAASVVYIDNIRLTN